MPNANRFGLSCCCGTGPPPPPTPGFLTCCPSNPIPATLNLTWTFRAGTSGATYNNDFQDTTLSYVTTFPAYAGGGTTTGAYVSPLLPLTDTITGNQIYYIIRCSVGSIGLALGQVSAGFPLGSSACYFIATYTCSPFLASGVIPGSSPCFGSFGFGAPGDNLVLM